MPDLSKPAQRHALTPSRASCGLPRLLRAAGYALHEALCGLIVLGAGLLPLMALAPNALAQLRALEALAQLARLAVETAETESAWTAPQSQRADLWWHWCATIPALPCTDGARLATAGPLGEHGGLRAIALWVRP